jgi:hypothetical protein
MATLTVYNPSNCPFTVGQLIFPPKGYVTVDEAVRPQLSGLGLLCEGDARYPNPWVRFNMDRGPRKQV